MVSLSSRNKVPHEVALVAEHATRSLQSDIDLVQLTDFDVQLALTKFDGSSITFEVADIVSGWMNEHFRSCLVSENYADEGFATFNAVVILERTRRQLLRRLDDRPQVIFGERFTAGFQGAALFTMGVNETSVPQRAVEVCQRSTFLRDDQLLERLQASSADGLGLNVVGVKAYINPNARVPSSTNETSLEVVIVIAIVIACVAFLFLVFAIYWAYRYDRKNREAYLSDHHGKPSEDPTYNAQDSPESKDRTTEEERTIGQYPSVIGGDSAADGVYPESVISEDINSSLTQYYQSGLQNYAPNSGGRLQDAGSVSSMESYGYSLEGYAPSLATPLPNGDNISTAMPSDRSQKDSSVITSEKL